VDGVLVDQVATENVVQLDPRLVARAAWGKLGLDRILRDAGLNPAQIATAQLLVAKRLIEPLSEWALIDWAERAPPCPNCSTSASPRPPRTVFATPVPPLFAKRKFIESALRGGRTNSSADAGASCSTMSPTPNSKASAPPTPKHEKKKQKRNDCRQVAVGMAFDERGLPLAHEVFEGNISDTKTLVHLPDRLHLGLPGEDGREKPMVILDPGLAYHLLCCVRERLRAKGDSRDWKTLRRPLSTHGLLTTRPPLEDGRVLHIRKASIPGAHQAKVFQKLGINWKAEVPPQKRFVKS